MSVGYIKALWIFFPVHTVSYKPRGKRACKALIWKKCFWEPKVALSGGYHPVRDIKPRILFSPIFSTKFSQLEQLKKKTNFLLVQNRFFLRLGPMKSLFSFSTEKNSWKNLGKTRFVVWCFDLTNKIYGKRMKQQKM